MTIVPRTGPVSASVAFASTSWYQRGKSADCEVSTPATRRSLVSRCRPPRSRRSLRPPAGEARELLRGDRLRALLARLRERLQVLVDDLDAKAVGVEEE